MWLWNRQKRREDFPANFAVQKIGITPAIAISHFPAREIAAYFRQNPSVADRLLAESYDKIRVSMRRSLMSIADLC